MGAGRVLRDLLAAGGVVRAVSAHDALTARLVEQAGFPAIAISGNALAASALGVPDLGLISFGEVLSCARRIAGAVDIPVLVDADDGYGNAVNVVRTVREFERAGLAGLTLEDQVSPKRCGHLPGSHPVIPVEEMAKKVEAACWARREKDFFIVARTDALSDHGLPEAIRRANAYAEAGADMVFIEKAETLEDLRRVAREVRAPLRTNLDAACRHPGVTLEALAGLGYRMVTHPWALRYGLLRAAREILARLREEGSLAGRPEILGAGEDYHRALGLREYQEIEDRFLRS